MLQIIFWKGLFMEKSVFSLSSCNNDVFVVNMMKGWIEEKKKNNV